MSHKSEVINTKGHWAQGIVWKIQGSQKSPYNVRMNDWGFECDCISFRKCKHIKEVEKMMCGDGE